MEPPAHWTLVPPPPHSLHPGSKFNLTLNCVIDPTWHIYALEEPEGGPIPTEIGLSGNDTIQLLSVDQQPPRVLSDTFYRQRTSLFEHEAHFTLLLKLPAKPLPKSTVLHVSVRYQACNDKVCLPPRAVLVDLPLAASLH